MPRLIAILLLLLPYAGDAQTMQGYVTDVESGKPLYPVTVVNTFTQQSTSTDERGFYSLPAKDMDVVAFTYIGYKDVKKPKPTSVLIATVNLTMEHTEYQLQEFRLRPGHLTQYQMDSAERASIYRRPLAQRPPSPFNSPVSAIADKFSRKSKMVYQFQKNFAAGEVEKFIDTRYTPEIVASMTGATGDTIGHFMYANPMPYDFARQASDLELKMWIRDNYRQWIKTQVADTVKQPAPRITTQK